MKHYFRIATFAITIFISPLLNAKDIVYIVSGKVDNVKVSLDSILFENLSNGTRMLFEDLPEQSDYEIILSAQDDGTTGLNLALLDKLIEVKQNLPGQITIGINRKLDEKVQISIYDVQGRKLHSREFDCVFKENIYAIALERNGFFFVEVNTSYGTKTYKAVGVGYSNHVNIATSDAYRSKNDYLKSERLYGSSDFKLKVGDSLRVSIYKNGYYASPKIIKAETSQSLSIDLDGLTITDIDGNTYKIVKIGDQWWTAENLATTKYNDGTDILNVVDSSEWAQLSTPAYCWYNNDEEANKDKYGALYNWYTIETGNLCPAGWHVPTDEEWKQLEMNIGMSQSEADEIEFRGTNEGAKLKAKTGWSDDGNGTDKFGFSALPGGYRLGYEDFGAIGNSGYWYSSSQYATTGAWHRALLSTSIQVIRYYSNKNFGHDGKQDGLSVRCIKD